MQQFRAAISFPIYFLAMIFHLLTAALTVLAQNIAGENYESGRDNAVRIDAAPYARTSIT